MDYRESGNKVWGLVIAAMVIVIVCLSIVLISINISPVLKAQGETSIRDAIIRSANQCLAVEGSYPATLEYLEDNYGLVVNKDDYIITYEIFAENVSPNVMVIAR